MNESPCPVAGISRYWRTHTSRKAATELALALRALRKVARHLGRNVKPVFWKGMEPGETDAIVLNPDVAKGTFPVPFERFDLLVGQVVREGLASLEWKEWVTSRVRNALRDLPREIVPYLDTFLETAEDIYVDEIAKAEVWSLYLARLWKADLEKEGRDPRLPPSARSLAQAWKRQEIAGKKPAELHQDYQDPLRNLADSSKAIREVATLSSPLQRREARVRLYLEAWTRLHHILAGWERFSVSPDAVPLFDEAAPPGAARKTKRHEEAEDTEGPDLDPSHGLDKELADEVNNLMEDGEAELTRALIVAVEDPEAGSMRTLLRHGTAKSSVPPDPEAVKRFRRIFGEQEHRVGRTRKRRVRRGLIEGKLDAHRLFRVPLDGKVFKKREPPGSEHLWHVCVLVDASASMAGKGVRRKPWPVAEKAFASLAEAARGSRNLLDVYAYHEEENRCVLTQLYHGGNLYTVLPGGRTPSGQAIMATALTVMKKGSRNRLLLHITDGASNCGIRLSDAVKLCRKHLIEVFTIGCGCNRQTEDFLRQCFPGNRLCFLDNIRGLPLVLEYILRKRLLSNPRHAPSRQGQAAR